MEKRTYDCEACARVAPNFNPRMEPEADGHVADCPWHSPDKAAAIREARMMTFAPYGDGVVVKQDPLRTHWYNSGLIRAQRIADWTAYGRVLAVGPGPRDPDTGVRIAPDIKVGDHVLFDWRPSHEEDAVNRICGDRTILLRSDECLAVIEECDEPAPMRCIDESCPCRDGLVCHYVDAGDTKAMPQPTQ